MAAAGARRWAVLLLATLLAGGCSATRLAYDNMERLVAWEVRKLVRLDREQSGLLRAGFGQWRDWHRSTQLPLYAEDLRSAKALLDGPATRSDLERLAQRARAHVEIAMMQAHPRLSALLRTLSDEQVAALLHSMDQRFREHETEMLSAGRETVAQREHELLVSRTRRWLGSVTPVQDRLLQDWAAARVDLLHARFAARRAWERSFAQVLQTRHQPGLDARLAALFGNETERDPAYAEIEAREYERTLDKLLALHSSLTGRQREHLRKRVSGLAQDLEVLAARSV
jgi:hypothetical protein